MKRFDESVFIGMQIINPDHSLDTELLATGVVMCDVVHVEIVNQSQDLLEVICLSVRCVW